MCWVRGVSVSGPGVDDFTLVKGGRRRLPQFRPPSTLVQALFGLPLSLPALPVPSNYSLNCETLRYDAMLGIGGNTVIFQAMDNFSVILSSKI